MAGTHLAFVLSPQQLAAQAARSGPQGGDLAVTLHASIAHALRARNIAVAEAWDFLDSRDVGKNYDEFRRFCAHWWREAYAPVLHQGLPLAEIMHRDMWFPVSAACNAQRIFSRILERFRPAEASLCVEAARAYFWDPPGGPPPDILNAVALHLVETAGLSVLRLQAGEPAPQANPGPRPEPPELPAVRDGLLVFLSDTDFIRHREKLEALFRRHAGRAVLLMAGAYPVAPQVAPVVPWYPLLAQFPADSATAARLDAAHEAVLRSGPASGDDAALLGNPHLHFLFAAFRDRLKLGSRIADAAGHVLDTLRPRLFVCGLDAYGPGAVFTRAAQARGVPTLALQHGSISPDFHQFERLHSPADQLVVDGEYGRRQFERLGRRPASITVIAPQLPPPPPRPAPAREVVLLTALGGYGLSAPICDHGRLRRDWLELLALMQRRRDLRFVLRPHPRYDHFGLYDALSQEAPGLFTIRREGSLEEALSSAAAAVLVSRPSAAALEALRLGVPLVYLRSALYDIPELGSALDDPRLPSARRVAELEPLLDDLLSNPVSRERVLADAAAFLRDFHSPRPSLDPAGDFLDLVQHLWREPAREKEHP